MSLIQRKWLADQIINNAKVDHTDTFKIGGLRVDETTAVGGISVGTPNNYDAIHIRRDSSAAIRLEQTGGRTYQLNTLDGTYNVRDIGDSANRLIIKRFSPTVGRLGVNADDPQDEGHFRSTSAQAAIRLDLDDGASGRAYHIASNSSGNLVVKDIDADATRMTITSAGDLVVARDATVTGNFQVQGTVTVINHDIIVSEELQVDGPTTLRDATTSSGLYVGTDATVAGNLHVVGDMLIDDVTLDQVNMNDATVANRLVTNNLKVNGDASVIGTTQLEGGLIVKSTGNSTFETDVLMNGGLQVDGGTNLIGTLSVYGDATAYQKLLVEGDVSCASNVRCSTFDVMGAVGVLNTDLLPATNGTYDLGAGSKWRDVRCVNAYGTHGYFDDATVVNRLVTNNLKVDGDASVIGTTQLEGGLVVKSTGNSTFETDVLMNGGLQVDGGTDLIGTLSVYGDATAYQKLLVEGDVSCASNVRCSTFDVMGAVGVLNTDLLPATNGTYDLGAGSKWRDVRCVNAYGTHGYFDDATVVNRLVTNNLKVDGDASVIGTTQLEGGLVVKSTGNSTFETDVLMNGELQVDGGTNLIGTLSVYGDATAYQKLLVAGDVSCASNVRCSTFDVVGAVGVLNTDLLPATSGTYDLGAGNKWRDVRCVTAYANRGNFGDATIDTGNLLVAGDVSSASNIYGASIAVIGDMNAYDGYFSGDVNITKTLDVSDDLRVTQDATITGNLYVQAFNDTTYGPASITGFSSYSTNQTHYKKLGHDAILLLWNITGLSNSTEFKFDLPFTAKTSGYEWTVACGYS